MADALQALYEAMFQRLRGGGVWGDRVFPDFAPGDVKRPLLIVSYVGGGERNDIRKHDPGLAVDVKCIALNLVDALAGAGQITTLLDDEGDQDKDLSGVAGVVTGDAEWIITTITQGLRIHQVDNWSENGVPIYHSGHEFRVTMEAL